MTRKNISSRRRGRATVGYSRAVRIGNLIEVAGTTAVDERGEVVGPDDPYRQARYALEKIGRALGRGRGRIRERHPDPHMFVTGHRPLGGGRPGPRRESSATSGRRRPWCRWHPSCVRTSSSRSRRRPSFRRAPLSGPRIAYALAMPRPHTHLFEVTITIDGWSEPRLDLVMPSWTPGSYMIREYARHVQDFAVTSDGHPRPGKKTAKDAWSVRDPAQPGGDQVTYRVYAHDLTVRTCHLDATHGFANGAAVFLFVLGHTHEPVTLEITVPAALAGRHGPRAAGRRKRHLPVSRRATTTSSSTAPSNAARTGCSSSTSTAIPHRIALWGRGNEDEARLVEDTRALVRAQREFFGGVPVQALRVHPTTWPPGAADSSTATARSFSSTASASVRAPSYERFLELVSHEFFHVWNVKRVRPSPLGPFDYRRENHTRQLWTMEGVTSYYEKRFVGGGRAVLEGALPRARGGGDLEPAGAARTRAAVARSSRASTRGSSTTGPTRTRGTPASRTIRRGALVAMMLDLEIRRARPSARECLDDVVRHLAHQATLERRRVRRARRLSRRGRNGGRGARRRVPAVLRALTLPGRSSSTTIAALGPRRSLGRLEPGGQDGEPPGWIGCSHARRRRAH